MSRSFKDPSSIALSLRLRRRVSRGLHPHLCQLIHYYGNIFLYLMGNAGIKEHHEAPRSFSISFFQLRWTYMHPFFLKVRFDVI